MMYETIELPGKEYLSVKLQENDLVYHYTKVKIDAAEPEAKDAQLTFEIEVDDNPNDIDTSVENVQLNKLLGSVLLDLIGQGTLDDGKHK